MNTRSLIKGVSVVATALTIALGGVGIVSTETGLVRRGRARRAPRRSLLDKPSW